MSHCQIERIEPRLLLSGTDVLTYHNDLSRDGANLSETILAPSNVNIGSFGKLLSLPVDGQIYAQPLYISGLKMPDAKVHNVAFVATEHDSVYAFDADTGQTLWHRSFIDPAHGITTVASKDLGALDISPEFGITGTPVIDRSTHTLYVASRDKVTVTGAATKFEWWMRSIDLLTGQDRLGGKQLIQTTVVGTGEGYVAGPVWHVPFDPFHQNQRPALLLYNGVVYAGFASQDDIDPYHGWLIGFDSQTLKIVSVFNASPDGLRAPIWMAGAAPAADANGIYVATGNGTFDAAEGGRDWGDSVLRLVRGSNGTMRVADSFTPFNQAFLNENDLDVGSGGVTLLPGNLALTGDKAGNLYLVNRANLGGFHLDGNKNVQTVTNELNGKQDYFTAAYFNGAIYFAGLTGHLRAVRLSGGKLVTPQFAQSSEVFGYPGATPSVSANGASNGIVWAIERNVPTGDPSLGGAQGHAILHAYDAATMRELYSSASAANNRDQAPYGIKFSVPTIADGHVLVGTGTALVIYGLRPTVKSFTLINADTNQPIETLQNGATIKLSSLPTTHLSVRIDTNAEPVGSVEMTLDTAYRAIDNLLPYALFGDTNGDYAAGTFSVGKHTITATPFDLPNAGGHAGPMVALLFTVTA